MWATCVIKKNLPIVNNRPVGEKSANLVALLIKHITACKELKCKVLILSPNM
jgi:hypothetical protein